MRRNRRQARTPHGRAALMAFALGSACLAGGAAAQVLTAPAPAPGAVSGGVVVAEPQALIPIDGPGLPGPVVLELFTAQGCASCPPADDLLTSLALRSDVIALALHVDYWDYIGWVDSFALPEHTQRQQTYARLNGLGTIYTPQMVVNGTHILEGFRAMQILDAVEAHRQAPPVARLTLSRAPDGALTVEGVPVAEPPPLVASRAARPRLAASMLAVSDEPEVPHDVVLVRYLPRAHVEILAGENAGRRGAYVNIVTEWQALGTWDLSGPFQATVPLTGDQPAVVLVQEAGQGAIVAAGRLD